MTHGATEQASEAEAASLEGLAVDLQPRRTSPCSGCGRMAIPCNVWSAASQQQRDEWKQRGFRRAGGRGLCVNCYQAAWSRGDLDRHCLTVHGADSPGRRSEGPVQPVWKQRPAERRAVHRLHSRHLRPWRAHQVGVMRRSGTRAHLNHISDEESSMTKCEHAADHCPQCGSGEQQVDGCPSKHHAGAHRSCVRAAPQTTGTRRLELEALPGVTYELLLVVTIVVIGGGMGGVALVLDLDGLADWGMAAVGSAAMIAAMVLIDRSATKAARRCGLSITQPTRRLGRQRTSTHGAPVMHDRSAATAVRPAAPPTRRLHDHTATFKTVHKVDARALWWKEADDCQHDQEYDDCVCWRAPGWCLGEFVFGVTLTVDGHRYVSDRRLIIREDCLTNLPPVGADDAPMLIDLTLQDDAAARVRRYFAATPLGTSPERDFDQHLLGPLTAAGYAVRPLTHEVDVHAVVDHAGTVVGFLMARPAGAQGDPVGGQTTR